MQKLIIKIIHLGYRAVRPILFLTDSETIHEMLTSTGKKLGKFSFFRKLFGSTFKVASPLLEQNIAGIKFENPIGLAAGFDYEARLPQFLPSLGFGFETVGTITNMPYEGNPKPRLGRLVKSKSLLVNKGFKNLGVDKTLSEVRALKFEMPVGISIGKTNGPNPMTQEEAVTDVVEAFKKVETAGACFSYYELNISCPNLFGTVEFYAPEKLAELISAIKSLEISRPIFVKMPIDKSDDETRGMLKVISKYKLAGVVFGNLQKNRKDPALVPSEVENATKGNFSGKPTERRSNELIRLAYREFGTNTEGGLVIIGCGGTFNPEDAYRKIKLGASLVELITGLVYEGPQLVASINLGLLRMLEQDGFKNISEAVGQDAT